MSEHDDTLQAALEENNRPRSEREESLRKVASSEYSGHLRCAERIYWLYALGCVALGVAAINFFARGFDTKTLIGSAVLILVLYETTVLMKLWFAMARMKMDVLKEMKLLRLEVARVAVATGVKELLQPPVKYEPMSGMPGWERKCWLAMCLIVALAVSTWTSQAWHLGGRDSSADMLVTLAADGSAEEQAENERPYSIFHRPSGFSYYAPRNRKIRFLDPTGSEMPVKIVATRNQNRHDVTYTDSVFVDGTMRYTRISEVPKAAELEAGVWTYRDGIQHDGGKKKFKLTILPPTGAKLLSAKPIPTAEMNEENRTYVHFQGTASHNKKLTFMIRYKLPSTSEQEE